MTEKVAGWTYSKCPPKQKPGYRARCRKGDSRSVCLLFLIVCFNQPALIERRIQHLIERRLSQQG